jgi:hypothetical protein
MAAEERRGASPPTAPKEKKPGERPSMKDAIVWAEILGKPKALRRK